MSGPPYSKEVQLGTPHAKRYRRKVAPRKAWERIIAAKCWQPCRICGARPRLQNLDPHHLVERVHGGDDLDCNIVGLCRTCHRRIHSREAGAVAVLLADLTDDEYAYVVQRGGEDYFERVYRVEYQR